MSNLALAQTTGPLSDHQGDSAMTDRAAKAHDNERLPPEGASPAGDLQRMVSDAALRNFYASPRAGRFDGWRRPAAIVGVTVACWAAVFGLGAMLLHG